MKDLLFAIIVTIIIVFGIMYISNVYQQKEKSRKKLEIAIAAKDCINSHDTLQDSLIKSVNRQIIIVDSILQAINKRNNK